VATGVVAGGHPDTCAAGAAALRAGGNAFDAVAAAGFVATVAEPCLASLGGGGFCLARTAAGDEVLFDFFVDTPGRGLAEGAPTPHFEPVTVRFPGSDQTFNVGLGSVAVPGVLAGLVHVHRRLGRLPLADVVAGAAALASDGVVLNEWQASVVGLLEPILRLSAEGRTLFTDDGRLLGPGDRLVNPGLGALLADVAAGDTTGFYGGELAARVSRDMAAGNGLLTGADLAAYEVIEREPLAIDYRDVRLLTNPAPSFGGSLLALALRLLEQHDVAALPPGSPRHLSLLGSVMVETDVLRAGGALGPADLDEATLAAVTGRVRVATGGTTHVSVVDGDGNVASLSMSNGEGSGYVVPGAGVMLNNMLGEDDLHPEGFHRGTAGERVASMMSPTVVVRDGRPVLALGSGGSKRIRTAILQVVSAVVDHGIAPEVAVEAPRAHWDGEHLQVEPGFAADALDAARRRWSVNEWRERNLYFGGVHAATPGHGAGDPRRGGSVVVVG
jgi:gamma-glutamyltranspeptidase/glutathione hydrolase